MKNLYLITARGGSKGIPEKNTILLNGKPLIHYSIEYARLFTTDDNICLSTDDKKIIDCAKEINLHVPFIRPAYLAEDKSDSYSVIQHAVSFYANKGFTYDVIVLLQPTSPLRKKEFLLEALKMYRNDLDMVVSVYESELYHIYSENNNGYLYPFFSEGSKCTCRQDAPKVYNHNGSIYIINTNSLKKYSGFHEFNKVVKYKMERLYSIDIDSPLDLLYADFLLKNNIISIY